MEVLINIVVTIAVILYVLKRMQEVAKKGGELTGPPPPARMFGEEDDEEAPTREQPRRSSPETTQMPKRIEVPAMPTLRPRPVMKAPEPTVRKFSVPAEPPRPRQRAVPEVRRPQHRHVTAPAETAPSRETRIKEVVRENEKGRYADSGSGFGMPAHAQHRGKAVRNRPLLTFCRNDIVRGVIMSEVLGPPVSMRQEAQR